MSTVLQPSTHLLYLTKLQKFCYQQIWRKVNSMYNASLFTHRLIYFTCLVFVCSKVRCLIETPFCLLGLDAAYRKPFLSNTAIDFISSLHNIGNRMCYGHLQIYARTISVVQSFGMGKLCLLTEVCLYSISRHYLT